MTYAYSVIVVGGGHAGLEAAMASARMGEKTLLITLNKHMMGNLPCNPSIGGSAKGIVVREIDALGGAMGVAADQSYLQIKLLNTGKGASVQCLRAQSDKLIYPRTIQRIAEETENLTIEEGMVIALLHDSQKVFGVKLADGKQIHSQAVILTTGTYMQSEILIGHEKTSGGPDGEKPSLGLSPYLKNEMGLELFRLKTGTPPRIKRSSIDFSKMTPQYGSSEPLAFSYLTKDYLPLDKQVVCHLIHTSPITHQIIIKNLKASAMFGGLVTGVGPRYCPSIEDKVVRFSDKEKHQLFIEPESKETESMYLQGFSTSMPRDIQEEMVRSLPGLEKAVFLKYAYAIEYDAFYPTQLWPTLELKKWPGLYGAGQIIGTSGYEEAAGLGLMAGINAVLKIRGQAPFVLRRDQAYIGVMIDDLVTKGTTEPYRLMSSRAEYRLLLRHDNADLRLTEIGHRLGVITKDRYTYFTDKNQKIDKSLQKLKKTILPVNENTVKFLDKNGSLPYAGGLSAYEILKRPEIKLTEMIKEDIFPNSENLDATGLFQLETMVKFEGYVSRQIEEAARFAKLEEKKLSQNINYIHLDGLSMEARQYLDKIKPTTLGQASRIPGVNPSDIAVLVLYLKKGELHEHH